jgi:hypothetical protein
MKSPNQLRSVTNSLSLLLDHVNLHLCDWLDGFAVKAAASP